MYFVGMQSYMHLTTTKNTYTKYIYKKREYILLEYRPLYLLYMSDAYMLK